MESPLSAKAALLQALETPACGAQLLGRVRERTAGHVRPGPGSVYPALRALERAGLVRGTEGRGGSVGRPRRYYELTLKGVAAAMAQRDSLAGFFGARRPHAPHQDADLMRERIRNCAEVSAFVLRLRQATLSAPGR